MPLERTADSCIEPVLTGCHPDPSVCRWGEEFVMVTSSFTYWPGLPIHRSSDLKTWHLVGHVLDRAEVLGRNGLVLDGLDVSDGVWAPTIRVHEGTLYVVFSTARDRRADTTYLCTATDPSGPWSDPLPLQVKGIDPSLYFEEDRCWLTACRDTTIPGASGPGELFLRELCLSTLQLIGEEKVLWHGALHGAWVEGPRIFRRENRYHLIAAEGGTERHHAVTAACAEHLEGPWSTDPRSPLLTHRHLSSAAAVQDVGHADLVDDPDGSTWALLLGTRPIDGGHVMGREVFLTEVTWEAAGPVFAGGRGTLQGAPPLEHPSSDGVLARAASGQGECGAGGMTPWPLPLQTCLRGPVDHVGIGSGHWLTPSPEPLTSRGTPSLVGMPQDSHAFCFEAQLSLQLLAAGSRTGLVAYQHQDAFFALDVVLTQGGGRSIEVLLNSAAGPRALARWELDAPVADEHGVPVLIGLALSSDGTSYAATVTAHGQTRELVRVSHHQLASENVGGFVGVLLGLSAQADHSVAPVYFSHLRYSRLEPVSASDQLARC